MDYQLCSSYFIWNSLKVSGICDMDRIETIKKAWNFLFVEIRRMRTEKQMAHNSCYHTNSPSVKVNWIWWIGLGFHASWTRLCMEFHLFFVLNQIMHVNCTCTSTWTFSENKWNTIKFAKAHITFKIWASTKQKVEYFSTTTTTTEHIVRFLGIFTFIHCLARRFSLLPLFYPCSDECKLNEAHGKLWALITIALAHRKQIHKKNIC